MPFRHRRAKGDIEIKSCDQAPPCDKFEEDGESGIIHMNGPQNHRGFNSAMPC